MAGYSIINSVVSKRFYTIYTTYHTKVYQTQISQVRKSPVKYVFSATSSTSIFVPKNETYDDTRRSCRNYYVLQGTQSNL